MNEDVIYIEEGRPSISSPPHILTSAAVSTFAGPEVLSQDVRHHLPLDVMSV
jgi:hypothetical protein